MLLRGRGGRAVRRLRTTSRGTTGGSATTMRLDRFTLKAQEAVQAAQNLAAERSRQEIIPEHLLVALLEQHEGIVIPILQRLGADVSRIRDEAQAAIGDVGEDAGQARRAERCLERGAAAQG